MKRIIALLLIAVFVMMCGCSLRTRETASETTQQTETEATVSETAAETEQEETTAEETATVTQAATEEETTTVKAKTTTSKKEEQKNTASAKTTTSKKAEEKTGKGTTKQNGTTTTTKSAISSLVSAINDIVTTTAATTAPAPATTASAPLSPTGAKLSFSTTDMNGSPVSMSTYSGSKIVVFNMWEPWCGPCVREMPDLQKLYDNYRSKGLMVVGVYSTEENAKSTVESKGITYPIIRKSSEFNAFDTGYVPTTIIVDGNGNILTSEPIIGSRSYNDWESIVAPYLA